MGEIAEATGCALNWRALAPFGIEIDHDLAAPLSPAQEAEFVALFNAHGLIVAHGQQLSMERQRELCGLLGPILLRGGESGYMSNGEGEGPAAAALGWHADAAYTDAPFDALSLHALDVVDGASSTRFTSAEAVVDRLPPALRDAFAGATLDMISPGMDSLSVRTCDHPAPQALKRGCRAAISPNPHNGRPVFWGSEMQTAAVIGCDHANSRDLLNTAFDCLYASDAVHEHIWRTGDLIIWDNIGLQHARGSLASCGTRLLQRVIVGTSGVIPTLAG
jgi:taurine dioxygenase